MKFLVVIFSLVALVTSKAINDEIDLANNTAYGYITRVGMPLAARIREAEIQLINTGKRPKDIVPSTKIVDGSMARLGDIPYQAGLLGDFNDGQSVCGGSLLNPRRVLTAAHCWWDGKQEVFRFTVVLGSVMLYTGGLRIKTSDVIMHSQWDPLYNINDIAMINLPINVKFSNTIQPIALPSGFELQESFIGETVVASGFGRTADGAAFLGNTVLNYVPLQVITNAECGSVYRHVWPSNICTIGYNSRNICGGDSGGPLTLHRNNKPILIGVVAFGSDRSCRDGLPAGYTRVTAHIDWIYNFL